MTMSAKNKSVAAKKNSPNMKLPGTKKQKLGNAGKSSSNKVINTVDAACVEHTKDKKKLKKNVVNNATDIKLKSVTQIENEENQKCKEENEDENITMDNLVELAENTIDEIKQDITIELVDEEIIEIDSEVVHEKKTPRKEQDNQGTSQVKTVDPKYAVLAALGLVPITPLLTKIDTIIKAAEEEESEIIPVKMAVCDDKNDNKDTRLQCQKCDTYFISKSALRVHCIEKHQSVMNYYCKLCSVLFATRTQLLKHKHKQHNGQKPYTCTMCPLNFVCLGALTAHVRRHNGKLPYICKVCQKGFQYYGDLQEHGRVHQLKMADVAPPKKSYLCDVCKRVFRKPSDLERHVRVHTGEKPFACSVCGNRFQQSHNLSKHIMHIHTKEQSYECDLCKRIFNRSDVLNRHMLTHALTKPFQCDFCDLSFTRALQLRDHLANKHRDENIAQALEDLRAKSKSRKFNYKQKSENTPETSATTSIISDELQIIANSTLTQETTETLNKKTDNLETKEILSEKTKENSITDILSIVDKSMFTRTYKNNSKQKLTSDVTNMENTTSTIDEKSIEEKVSIGTKMDNKTNNKKIGKSTAVIIVDNPPKHALIGDKLINDKVLENKSTLAKTDKIIKAGKSVTVLKVDTLENKKVGVASPKAGDKIANETEETSVKTNKKKSGGNMESSISLEDALIKQTTEVDKSTIVQGNKRKFMKSDKVEETGITAKIIKPIKKSSIIKITANKVENSINLGLMKEIITEKSTSNENDLLIIQNASKDKISTIKKYVSATKDVKIINEEKTKDEIQKPISTKSFKQLNIKTSATLVTYGDISNKIYKPNEEWSINRSANTKKSIDPVKLVDKTIKDSTKISIDNIYEESTSNKRKLRKPTYEEGKITAHYPKVAPVKLIKKGTDLFAIKKETTNEGKSTDYIDSEKVITSRKTKKSTNKKRKLEASTIDQIILTMDTKISDEINAMTISPSTSRRIFTKIPVITKNKQNTRLIKDKEP